VLLLRAVVVVGMYRENSSFPFLFAFGCSEHMIFYELEK
jgi:hypothetical protein